MTLTIIFIAMFVALVSVGYSSFKLQKSVNSLIDVYAEKISSYESYINDLERILHYHGRQITKMQKTLYEKSDEEIAEDFMRNYLDMRDGECDL